MERLNDSGKRDLLPNSSHLKFTRVLGHTEVCNSSICRNKCTQDRFLWISVMG